MRVRFLAILFGVLLPLGAVGQTASTTTPAATPPATTWAPTRYAPLNEGLYAAAVADLRAQLAAAEAKLGHQATDVGVLLARLAYALARTDNTPWGLPYTQRQHAEATPLARRSITILEKNLGPNSLETGKSYIIYAHALAGLFRHPEGDPWARKALYMLEATKGDSPDKYELEAILRHYADELHVVHHDVEADEYIDRINIAAFGTTATPDMIRGEAYAPRP